MVVAVILSLRRTPTAPTNILFIIESSTIQDYFQKCSFVSNCNYFSIAEEGPYAGVCMGCIEGVTQPHQHFKFFAMHGLSEPPPHQLLHCPDTAI
eukprot:4082380-Amphidinium_carterae.1